MIRVKRKLIKFSNYSLCITVPKKMTDQLGWEKGDLLNLYYSEGDKTIKLVKNKMSSLKSATSEPEEKIEILPKALPIKAEQVKENEPVVLFQREKDEGLENKNLRW